MSAVRSISRWGRSTRAGRAAFDLLLAAVGVCAFFASSAGAKVINVPAIHKAFSGMPPELGILPSPAAVEQASQGPSSGGRAGASGTPTCDASFEPDCHSPLTNPGGNPVQHAEKDYLFFWSPTGASAYPAGYVAGMQKFLSGLASGDYSPDITASNVGNPLSVVQQYYDLSGPGGAKRFIPLAIQKAGTIVDRDPYPAASANGHQCRDTDPGPPSYKPTTCLIAADYGIELANYVTAHHLPTGIDVEYFVLTPPRVGSCDSVGSPSKTNGCAMTAYCAFHTYFSTGSGGSTRTMFANVPYLDKTPCDIGNYVNNDHTDSVVGTFSHELAETMTDPLLNAWRGKGGGSDEVGDKCSYQYVTGATTVQPLDFTGLPNNGSGYYNTTLNGRDYLLQMEFDDSANGCNQWDTQPQPTATIVGPGSVNTASPAAFSLGSVTAPPGVAYVSWNFGDGSSTTVTNPGSVYHTYQTAGTYTATAVLTDNHGNEVRITNVVTVTGKGLPASLSISVTPKNPAPKAPDMLKFTGRALSGGTLGSAHNKSELDVYEQSSGSCATTWSAENARAKAGKATSIGYALLAAGPFSLVDHRTATPTKHTTVRFCGFVSRSVTKTDAHATASYTST